jgi:hypothetical protein
MKEAISTLKTTSSSYYVPRNELLKLKGMCSTMLPPLEEHHLEILEELELKKANAMNTNRTTFFINEIFRYCKEQKVLRTTHMGETRGGKSEGAQMTSILHTYFFNKLFEKGHYDNVDVDIKKEPFKMTVDNIHRNKTYYLEHVRNGFKAKTLVYGTVNVIDETEDSIGGLGSMSEEIEMQNYNNIVAKYNLGEHWINPRGFIDMNTSYGIHWFIKDVKKKVNWGLLYRLESWSKGISPQSFIGWVCFPLHENTELRDAYEEKKNAWINEVISGGGDPRSALRKKASEIVANNALFGMMKTSKSFVLTNQQQLDIIDDLITDGTLSAFNAQERERIADRARLIVKMRKYPQLYKPDNEQFS